MSKKYTEKQRYKHSRLRRRHGHGQKLIIQRQKTLRSHNNNHNIKKTVRFASPDANQCKNDVVSTFIEMSNIIKMYHWSTRSYAEHKATDELHSRLGENMDKFMEVLLGLDENDERFPRLQKTMKLMEPSDRGFRDKIFWFRTYLSKMDHCFASHSDLMNIRDEILGDLNQYLYLSSLKKGGNLQSKTRGRQKGGGSHSQYGGTVFEIPPFYDITTLMVQDFIQENAGLFNIQDKSNEYKINRQAIDKYVETNPSCNRKFFGVLKEIVNKSTYVDYNMFINAYEKAVIELKEWKTGDSERHIFVILPLNPNKSNFYFTLHFCKLLFDANVDFKVVEVDKLYKLHFPDWGPLKFVLCDDVAYSGTQIIDNINQVKSKNMAIRNIFLCLIGYTDLLSKKIKTITDKSSERSGEAVRDKSSERSGEAVSDEFTVEINQGSQLLPSTSFKDVLTENGIKLKEINLFKPESKELFTPESLDRSYKTLIYTFFKYPDHLSAFPYMCGFHKRKFEYNDEAYKTSSDCPPLKLFECDEDIPFKDWKLNMDSGCNDTCISPFYKTEPYQAAFEKFYKELVNTHKVLEE